jgi:hypothetical protein
MSQESKGMSVQRLRELYSYDKLTGYVFNIKLNRRVMPAHDGFVMLHEPLTKHAQKYKLTKLCYTLETGIECSKTDRVIQKDLNPDNYTFANLRRLTRDEYTRYKMALKNVTGGICLKAHPVDMYNYKLFWYEDGKYKSRIVGDIVSAKREETKARLKYSKILMEFCTSV